MRLALLWISLAAWAVHGTAAACGERVEVPTHDATVTPYVLALPPDGVPLRAVAVLLPGGDGHLRLGHDGCPRALGGNFLVRSAALLQQRGMATALVDVPSDHRGADGLAGFRNGQAHAHDLGLVIADLRLRVKAPVWVIGTSRGSISAANAAARLAGGPSAPDGVVLSAVVTAGAPSRKPWTTQTVHDLPLAAVVAPAFLIGHAQDHCRRSPASGMTRVLESLGSARKQMLIVQGGPWDAATAARDPGACEGRSPHGFFGQEAEAVNAIVRFIASP